jgi:chemotaxis regulatin CheY-phosphate phosphatase CheZ
VTTKKDIVARLRDCDQGLLADCETHVDLITDFSCVEDAAKLIEQLRERNSLLLQQRGCRDEAARRAARCIDRLKIKVGQMTEERDEVRREWCRLWARTDERNLAPTQAARLRDWDCFKDDNHDA